MYKQKITHCAPIIDNIYGKDYPYISKEGKDIWIEVETEYEAVSICSIETNQKWTFELVQQLTEHLNNK